MYFGGWESLSLIEFMGHTLDEKPILLQTRSQHQRSVADPGGPKGPCLVKIGQKRWPPIAASYISCFLAPLSEVSGSATEGNTYFIFKLGVSLTDVTDELYHGCILVKGIEIDGSIIVPENVLPIGNVEQNFCPTL